MEYLNAFSDDKMNKFIVFSLSSNHVCDCNFCCNREIESFSIMVLSDKLWGMTQTMADFICKFQSLNPLVECEYSDGCKMILSIITNHIKADIREHSDKLVLSFHGEQFDISILWEMELKKLVSNEMFHHFVKPLMGALARSHEITMHVWDQWKSTKLYLDVVCTTNSIKLDAIKSFLNIPNEYSHLEKGVDCSELQVGCDGDFNSIRGPFERQVEKQSEYLKNRKAESVKTIEKREPTFGKNHKSTDGNIRLQHLQTKLAEERTKSKAKKKKLI